MKSDHISQDSLAIQIFAARAQEREAIASYLDREAERFRTLSKTFSEDGDHPRADRANWRAVTHEADALSIRAGAHACVVDPALNPAVDFFIPLPGDEA